MLNSYKNNVKILKIACIHTGTVANEGITKNVLLDQKTDVFFHTGAQVQPQKMTKEQPKNRAKQPHNPEFWDMFHLGMSRQSMMDGRTVKASKITHPVLSYLIRKIRNLNFHNTEIMVLSYLCCSNQIMFFPPPLSAPVTRNLRGKSYPTIF